MQVVEIKSKEELNEFVGAQKQSQFLQSWQWGEFHKNLGTKIWRLGIKEEGKLIVAATIIKKTLPMGKSYFYCPRGPVGQVTGMLFNKIEKIASSEGVMFLRFEPTNRSQIANRELKITKTLDVQPGKTLILNLSKTESELLEKMHQKTRYNIRLAEKRGVKITETGMDSFDDFWRLMADTSERDNFRLHGIDYYKEMIKLDKDFIKLFFAEYRRKVIAANIISFFGDTVTYMHGASANEYRNVMAPYLLQWHCIVLAKKLGYRCYDFYGIDERKWPGVTKFKKGFSGKEIRYPGTFDLIFDSGWYNVYKMVRKVRRTF